MKTVRTRVKSALKRNSRAPTSPGPVTSTKLAVTISAAPSVPPNQERKTAIPVPISDDSKANEKQVYKDFRYEEEPVSVVNDQPETPRAQHHDRQREEAHTEPDGFTFTGHDPEPIYSVPEPIPITDDSRRSTPRKRPKAVPRMSSDSQWPSPSIASRLLPSMPPQPTNNMPEADSEPEEIKIETPVDVHYMLDEVPTESSSLLQQLQPTEQSFVEATPHEMPNNLPPLHELLAQHVEIKRLSSSLQLSHPDINQRHAENESEEKPLLESSLLTRDVSEILDSVWPMPPQTFASLGWTEHVLPSTAYYFSHAITRTVTDIDLRNDKKLSAVTQYLKERRSPTPTRIDFKLNDKPVRKDGDTIRGFRIFDVELPVEDGVDLWLQEARLDSLKKVNHTQSLGSWEFMPMKCWVLHASRAVTFEPPSEREKDAEEVSDEERLDSESRYWHYMSTHPAHVSLPQTAYDEALEVLTWCYTDNILQSTQTLPIGGPFTHKECRESLELFRSLSASATPGSAQIVRTRLVAQILLRYTEWRHKFLMKYSRNSDDVMNVQQRRLIENAMPFRRTITTLIKVIILLGIPYLYERKTSARQLADEEQVAAESSSRTYPIEPLEYVQPILAGLLLLSDLVMLALPNLGRTSEIAVVLSALCAVASIAAHFIASLKRRRYAMKIGDGNSHSIINALPVVLQAYAVGAFIVALTAYFFASKKDDRLTAWIIVAVWLGLLAVLTMATAISKKLA